MKNYLKSTFGHKIALSNLIQIWSVCIGLLNVDVGSI